MGLNDFNDCFVITMSMRFFFSSEDHLHVSPPSRGYPSEKPQASPADLLVHIAAGIPFSFSRVLHRAEKICVHFHTSPFTLSCEPHLSACSYRTRRLAAGGNDNRRFLSEKQPKIFRAVVGYKCLTTHRFAPINRASPTVSSAPAGPRRRKHQK
jgi:hypothetical protein